MRKLFILLLKFFTPLFVVVALYAWMDPFKVIWHYDSFYEADNKLSVPLDKDYVSTANYDNRYKDEHYDSFIFGNSRSIFYETGEWKKYLPAHSRPYHFDGSGESLLGIYKKILYIDSKQEKINNVLLIADHMILSRDKGVEGHLSAISPQVSGYTNLADFHLEFLRAFLSPKFFPGYIDYKVTGKIKSYMMEAALTDEAFLYNKRTNEMRHTTTEKAISEGTFYTPGYVKETFYKRSRTQKYSLPVLNNPQEKMLTEIAKIFKKHRTNYKIVINPLYDQEKLNREDLAYLQRLFGSDNVYDFSGINSITNDYRNYYEYSHYRPHVATAIMAEIYTK